MNQENSQITENFINIEAIIANKNPKLLKLFPRFLLNYIKRIIHQEEVNKAIYTNRNKYNLDFFNAILDEFGAVINAYGLENIPQSGRYLVASNHPLGGLDGMALMSVTGRVRKDIVFPVNDLLLYLPNTTELFIPVNKHGSNAENIALFENSFASDSMILYFPAGLCSRKIAGVIKDLEWKKTFISKARKHKRNIIPCFIEGKNSNFFYSLANIRKRLGIKANIEMMYLVNEMYKQKNKIINITFGKPISYNFFDNKFSDYKWANFFRDYVYEIGKGNNEDFNIFINKLK